MPTYPNVHKYLSDNEIHNPKNFTTAAANSYVAKGNDGNLVWHEDYYTLPVIDLVDGSAPPPTSVDGDRYVIVSTTVGSTVNAGWDGALFNDIVQYYGTSVGTWNSVTPKEGFTVYDKDGDNTLVFNGSDWVPITGGTDDSDLVVDFGKNVLFKNDGNQSKTAQENDWKIFVNSEQNLEIAYYNGTSWVTVNQFRKG